MSMRIADIHATAIYSYIKNLNCPSWQKDQIIDTIIELTNKRIALSEN